MCGKLLKSKLIFISIFLIAFCLVGSVYAEDNITDSDADIVDAINVTFPEKVYREDLGDIDVQIPENVSGNLKATINDVEFYNENVTGSVKVPITIPKNAYPIYVVNRITDHTTYGISLFFNGWQLKSNHTLNVMNYPRNFTSPGFADEILKDDVDSHVSLFFPESANGGAEIYIDGKLVETAKTSTFTFLNITNFIALPLGNHTVGIKYLGDDYYYPFYKNFTFEVVDMLISIPQNIVLDHDDSISARIINNTDGVVTVYVDNQQVFKSKLDKGEFLHSMFDDVTCGSHVIEFRYNASNFTKTKRVLTNVSYYVDTFNYGPYVYGSGDNFVIIVLEDFKKDLINITIDGTRYTDFEIDNSGWIELDVSRLDVGNHTLEFYYPDDGKYTPWSFKENFTVEYRIMLPYEYYLETKADAYLALPDSAKGNLELYIDSKLYKSAKLVDGYALITVNDLIPGEYNMFARYTGDDFNVSEESRIVVIYPDIRSPGEMYVGEDKSISVKTMKEAKGKVIFRVNGKNITVQLKDGIAKLPLKNFKAGIYDDIDAVYVGDNGYNVTLYSGVDILASKIKLTNVKVTGQGAKMKVYINGKLAKKAKVTFKVDGKTKKVKTDKKGVAAIKLNVGKHKLTAIYKDAKTTKTVNVHALSLKTIKVKKSAKKVTLQAKLTKKLKNKVIKFKFNGKAYKAKTNSKGIAKVTFKVKNLKVGKKIVYQASYGKDIVKKTAVVKK